jgi:ribonucleoside-diphosphate reductase alpha chain
MQLTKRDGSKEPFEHSKWQAYIAKICEGIPDVSHSMIEFQARPHFRDGMTSRELDEATLKGMVSLIDEESNPEVGSVHYQHAAGKHRITMLRKDVFGSFEVPRLYDIVKKNVELKLYTPDLLEWYTEAEWDSLNAALDHERDEGLAYAAVEQLIEKYLVQRIPFSFGVQLQEVRGVQLEFDVLLDDVIQTWNFE